MSAAVLSAGLSACNFFSQPTDIQTENLQSELARTQIAGIRATATVNAERLAITAEFAVESIQNAELQSTRIASTLIAQGTPFIEIPELASVLPTVDPVIASNPQQAFPTDPNAPSIANPLLTPGFVVTQGASARGDATLIPATPTSLVQSQTQEDTTGEGLLNIQVSARVGADDCAINPATSFSLGITDLYVVATASGINTGSLLTSRWLHEGTEVAFYEWTPNFDIDGACVWFHLPSASVPLTAGNWSVQLSLNGMPVGEPISFSIVG